VRWERERRVSSRVLFGWELAVVGWSDWFGEWKELSRLVMRHVEDGHAGLCFVVIRCHGRSIWNLIYVSNAVQLTAAEASLLWSLECVWPSFVRY
jgi:hypothetical protein